EAVTGLPQDEGAGGDVLRAGRQPGQLARQPRVRIRGPRRRARRGAVQLLAGRDVDSVRRPERIRTYQNPVSHPSLNEITGPVHGGFNTVRPWFLARRREFRDVSLRYAEERRSHGVPVKELPPGIALPEVLVPSRQVVAPMAAWAPFS